MRSSMYTAIVILATLLAALGPVRARRSYRSEFTNQWPSSHSARRLFEDSASTDDDDKGIADDEGAVSDYVVAQPLPPLEDLVLVNEPGDYDFIELIPGDYMDIEPMHNQQLTDPSCPPSLGISCFSFLYPSPVSINNTMAMTAVDMAEMIYYTDVEVEDYAKNVLGAAHVEWIIDNVTGTHVLIASSQTIMVVFRGYSTDWSSYSNIQLSNVQITSSMAAQVHTGINTGIDSIYTRLVEALDALNPAKIKPVVFTGHSIGSAMAMLAAAKVQASQHQTITAVYSFGGPRVGDASWHTAYSSLGLDQKTLRYVFYKDPLPMLPPLDTGYVHVGRMVYINEHRDECMEIQGEEYDVCGVSNTTCTDVYSSDIMQTFINGTCQGDKNAVVDSTTAAFCNLINNGFLGGNACCLLEQGLASNTLPQLDIYHSVSYSYFKGLHSSCVQGCELQRYQQCGSGMQDSDFVITSTMATSGLSLDELTDQAARYNSFRFPVAEWVSSDAPSQAPLSSSSSLASSSDGSQEEGAVGIADTNSDREEDAATEKGLMTTAMSSSLYTRPLLTVLNVCFALFFYSF